MITANDRDYGQNVRISITSGNNENYFRLESGKNYAVLRQNRLVDKPIEEFLLKFCAIDDGVPPRSVESDLKVNIFVIIQTKAKFLRLDDTRKEGTKGILSSKDCK